MEKDSNKQVEGRKLTEAQIRTMKYLRMMARKAQEWKAATEKQANRKLSKVAWNESDANPWEEKSDLGKKSLNSDQADHDPNQAKSEFLNRPSPW